jgi:hypothetical protein
MDNVKCVSEGKIGARGANDVFCIDLYSIPSFQIGTVERVKNL